MIAMWYEVEGHLEIKDGILHIGGISTLDLAKEYGTPLYVYHINRALYNYDRFLNVISKFTEKEVRIHYAMKANPNKILLEELREAGSWIDAVAPGEVEFAINVGFPPEKIMYTGASVSNKDMERILSYPGRIRINIDSFSQLRRLKRLLEEHGIETMEISFRIDPGVRGQGGDWKTITAGKESHGVPIKFGIPENEVLLAYKEAMEYGFAPVGIQMHIGSQWLSMEEVNEYLIAVERLVGKAKEVEGLGCKLEFIDFGGGPGIRYKEEDNEFPLDYYARETCKKANELDVEALAFEPGRYIVGDCGLLLAKVNTIKERYNDTIIGVDTGFNHLIRPAFYGAYHEAIVCNKADQEPEIVATIAGNLCETGDVLAVKRALPRIEEGDIIAFHNAGAYAASMRMDKYNLREPAKEVVIVDGNVIE